MSFIAILYFVVIIQRIITVTCFRLELNHISAYNETCEKLFLRNQNIDSINANFFEGFKHLETLYLDNNNLDFTSSSVFLSSNTLNKITCNNCSLKRIYDKTFSKLPNLEKLILKHNEITEISPNAFRNNPNLKLLDLEYNKLVVFNKVGQLNYLTNLKFLSLSYNTEFHFAEDLPFISTKKYLVIECKNCSIDIIYKTTFEEIPNLYRVDLIKNKIKTIAQGAFNFNTKLNYVDLSYNPILTLDNIFQHDMKSLFTLICNNCSLQNITLNILKRFPNLYYLELNHNLISNFHSETLTENNLLKTLELEGNKLKSFPYSIIDNFPNLTQLCLDLNKFEPSKNHTILKQKYKDSTLRSDCGSNLNPNDYFENHPFDINKTGDIILYDLNKSNINIIIEELVVTIFSNNIVQIVPSFFKNPKFLDIKSLIMNNNTNFDFTANSEFLIHNNLEEFHCQYCGITNIYKHTFIKLPNIRIINLSYNKLHIISTFAFQHKNVIENLNLDGNQLKMLSSNVIDNLPSLKILTLSNNTEFDFPKDRIFLYSETLETFKCNHCGISSVYKDTFCRIPNLRYLYLNNNNIELLNDTSFVENKYLEEIYINNFELKLHVKSLCYVKSLKIVSIYFRKYTLNDKICKPHVEKLPYSKKEDEESKNQNMNLKNAAMFDLKNSSMNVWSFENLFVTILINILVYYLV